MLKQSKDLEKCGELILDFFKGRDSIKILDIVMDIHDEIIYSGMDKEAAKQKYLKVLYSLKGSNSLYSLLDEGDAKLLNLFLEDFLKIRYDGENYYIGNKYFARLSLYDFYNILIETKYLKKEQIQMVNSYIYKFR